MLRYLNIRNLAVIESLEVTFQPGLNVVTGETGAGKSIVVGAVGLLLGDRASADIVRTGEEARALPFGAVWDAFCLREGVPSGAEWLADIAAYERDVLSARDRAI